MITRKPTSKAQTTIPQPVRAALDLREGDEIAHVVEEGRMIPANARGEAVDDPFATDDPCATFGEWDGEADRKAYADL